MMRKQIGAALSAVLLLTALTMPAAAAEYDYNIEDGSVQNATRYPVAKAYTLADILYDLGASGGMSQPQDLYIGPDGRLYVADTGNNRILRFYQDRRVEAAFDNQGAGGGLKNPSSVFVDENGGMFVADTDNNRVVKLSAAGKYVEQFVKPKSELLPEDFVFNPRKIAVSQTGYLYAIKHQSLMSIDATNAFRGYVGTTQVQVSLLYKIKKLFANKKQQILLEKPEPVSALSFALGDDGLVYVTTADAKGGQLKKLNSVGKNIYPKTSFFGENVYFPKEDLWKAPNFIDVAVSKDGIVFLLEEWSGRIYVYDAEGNNLVVFGGSGEGKSSFKQPVALDVDDAGNVYVLDAQLNCVKVFAPTYFMQNVLQAVKYYGDGDYEKDIDYWRKVAEINENYNLANKGIAKSLLKQGDYEQAMEYYRLARDKQGYSKAFEKQRHQDFREHFPLVMLSAMLILAACIALLVGALKFIKRTMKKYDRYV